jgi:chromosome segregation ATPase
MIKSTLAILLGFALSLTAIAQTTPAPAPVDPDEAAAIAASDKIFSRLYTAESTVKSQAAEIAALKQQLGAEQAARAKAEAERDVARKAKADAKSTVSTAQQQLAAAAAKL